MAQPRVAPSSDQPSSNDASSDQHVPSSNLDNEQVAIHPGRLAKPVHATRRSELYSSRGQRPQAPAPGPSEWMSSRDLEEEHLHRDGPDVRETVEEENNTRGAGSQSASSEEEGDLEASDLDPSAMAGWTGQPSIRGSSEAMRMVLLNFNAIGITFTWGIEMTYCTPYLLSLGLSKSNTSLVWVAGPLSGLLVQPVIGVIADQSKSRWGRRRPFIVIGSIIVAFSLLTLGFTKEIVGLLVPDEEDGRTPTIILAVLAIYAVDFAINVVMSCARSLIVDTLSINKQQLGAAWSGRMSALGHVIGYAAGAVDLVKTFGTTLGDTQFKQLTLIATFFILSCSSVTCWAVTERVLVSTKEDRHQSWGYGPLQVFRQIWTTLRTLPPRIQAICWAQFWAWIGWFPFLFYGTTWVGETYFRYDVPNEAKDSKDVLGDVGRIGSTALVIYSFVTFAGAWLLPFVVKSPDDETFTARPPRGMASFIQGFSERKPDLLTIWICGHVIFASSMFLAPFATSFRFATLLVVICGLPWTIANWAPTAFLGVEVNKLSGATESIGTPSYRRLSDAGGARNSIELPTLGQSQALHLHPGPDPEGDSGGNQAGTGSSSNGELSGVYFGILNIYTTLPQFIGTFISALVFAVLEPGKSPELATEAPPEEHHDTDGPNAIAVCLFIGALCAAVAAFVTRRLKYL